MSSSFSLYDLPFSAASSEMSFNTTWMPAWAVTYAMPAPIMPAPITATFSGSFFSTPSGRDLPALMAARSKKNACVMFLNCWPMSRLTR